MVTLQDRISPRIDSCYDQGRNAALLRPYGMTIALRPFARLASGIRPALDCRPHDSDSCMHQAVLPPSLRMLNMAGKALHWVGVRGISLKPALLMKKARQNTNLNDFGPEDFREGLDRLCRSLEEDAALTAFGRLIAQVEILLTLENRLKLIHAFKVNRELSGAPIKRPLFILGLPQSGTALLHELLAQDPDHRVPTTWETKYPFPPPRTETYYSDPRIARVNRELKNVDRLLPELGKMYPMAAHRPQECVSITTMNFMSLAFTVSYRVPSYQQWLQQQAQFRGAYNLHYQFLQYLQWHHKAERWVLSSPGHLWSLDTLLSRYPDALIVQAHRDPVKVVSSMSSLTHSLRSMVSDKNDVRDIARHYSALMHHGLGRGIALREAGNVSGNRIFDIHYQALMDSPIAEIERLYDHFKLPFGPQVEKAMSDYLVRYPVNRYQQHRYHFMTTGLRLDEQRRLFRDYQERFGIPTEKV